MILLPLFSSLAKGIDAFYQGNVSIAKKDRVSGHTFRRERSKLNQCFRGDIVFKETEASSDGLVYFLKNVAEFVRKWIFCRNKKVINHSLER